MEGCGSCAAGIWAPKQLSRNRDFGDENLPMLRHQDSVMLHPSQQKDQNHHSWLKELMVSWAGVGDE